MPTLPDLSIVIQAGGESRRMGQDKALIDFLGKPLVQRLLDRLSPLAGEIIVTTNRPQEMAFLDVRLASDVMPGLGALGGLYTALSSATLPLVAVVACDMPFASPALLAAAAQILHERGCDAVVPCSANGLEPFHAIYRRVSCLPRVESALQANLRRVDAWFDQAQIEFMPHAQVLQVDPGGQAFINVNTPAELQWAEALARGNQAQRP